MTVGAVISVDRADPFRPVTGYAPDSKYIYIHFLKNLWKRVFEDRKYTIYNLTSSRWPSGDSRPWSGEERRGKDSLSLVCIQCAIVKGKAAFFFSIFVVVFFPQDLFFISRADWSFCHGGALKQRLRLAEQQSSSLLCLTLKDCSTDTQRHVAAVLEVKMAKK